MPRMAKIKQEHSIAIGRAANRFRDHEDMSRTKVARWVAQFEDTDVTIAIKVLDKIRYYSGSDIRRMLRDLVKRVYERLTDIPRNKIFFVPVGDIFQGAATLARGLKDTEGIRREQIKIMLELQKIPNEDIGAIVFVEDFSGSGKTLTTWWTNVEPFVLPKMAPIVIALLVMNSQARPRIEEFASSLIRVDELDESQNVLSPASDVFSEAEKQKLLGYCAKTSCTQVYLRGFDSSGLLVAFKHLCPNNSLPILWHQSISWRSLFKRRAI